MAIRWSGKRYHSFINRIISNAKGFYSFEIYYWDCYSGQTKYEELDWRIFKRHAYSKRSRLNSDYEVVTGLKDKRFDPETKKKINPYNR